MNKFRDGSSPQSSANRAPGRASVIWSRHTPKWTVKWIQVQVPGEHRDPSTPSNQNLHYATSVLCLRPPKFFWTFSSSFPSSHCPGSASSRTTTTLFPFSVLPTSISPTCRKEMPLPVLCVQADQETRAEEESRRYRRIYRACGRREREWRCEDNPE